jgi:hypothetical protein
MGSVPADLVPPASVYVYVYVEAAPGKRTKITRQLLVTVGTHLN